MSCFCLKLRSSWLCGLVFVPCYPSGTLLSQGADDGKHNVRRCPLNSVPTDSSSTEKWYVIRTKPRQEHVAVRNLEDQGYHCFFPRIQARRTRRTKRVFLLEPFFTSYLFVHLDLDQVNTAPIRSTPGVAGFVRFGSYVPPVSDELVNDLIERADENGVLSLPEPDFLPGQVVTIMDGPIAGYEAIFQSRNGHDRAMLLIGMLGGEIKVQVPVAVLSPQPTLKNCDAIP